MQVDNGIDSQGTELRVVDPGGPVEATVTRTGSTVTVTKASHGRQVGDRIDIETGAGGAASLVGRHTVTSVSAGAFLLTAAGADIATAANVTYRPLHALSPKSIGGFGGTRNVLDKSNLSSKSKRKKGGLRDNGQLQLTFNFDPAFPGHTLLRDALDTNAYLQVELEFTDDDKTCWACQTFVSAFTVSIGMDGFVEASSTLEVDGDIDVYTA